MDVPVSKKAIARTGWELVFTQKGRYFFYDTVSKCSTWKPSEELLQYLLEMERDRLGDLFDPTVEESVLVEDFITEEDFEESEIEENEIEENFNQTNERKMCENTEENEKGETFIQTEENAQFDHQIDQISSIHVDAKTSTRSKPPSEEHTRAVEAFKEMLLESPHVSPYKDWSEIEVHLQDDPRFTAIAGKKERMAIFDTVCPILAEHHAKTRSQRHIAAQESWERVLEAVGQAVQPGRVDPSWTELSRAIRREPWFRLLDSKQMERQLRDRIAKERQRKRIFKPTI